MIGAVRPGVRVSQLIGAASEYVAGRPGWTTRSASSPATASGWNCGSGR